MKIEIEITEKASLDLGSPEGLNFLETVNLEKFLKKDIYEIDRHRINNFFSSENKTINQINVVK